MNERIFELGIQAKREFDEHTIECERLCKPIEWVVEERLAELIVVECAEQISKEPFYADLAANHIKKHFGVEQ